MIKRNIGNSRNSQSYRWRHEQKNSYYLLSQDKHSFKKSVDWIKREMHDHDKECLFVVSRSGQQCGAKSQDCHAISKRAVVEPLADKNGKVMVFGWGEKSWLDLFVRSNAKDPVSLWDYKSYEPYLVSKNDATSAGFACNLHDNMFSPLDNSTTIDKTDKVVVFLAAFRTLLYAQSRLRQILWLRDYAKVNRQTRGANRSKVGVDLLKGQMKKSVDVSEAIRGQIIRLGKIQFDYADNLDAIPLSLITQTVQFQSGLRFASCGLMDSDTFDTFAIILPDPSGSDLHQLTTIQIERPDGSVGEGIKAIISSAESCKEDPGNWTNVFREILVSSDCVIGSPNSYKDLKSDEKAKVKTAIEDSSQAYLMEEIFQKK